MGDMRELKGEIGGKRSRSVKELNWESGKWSSKRCEIAASNSLGEAIKHKGLAQNILYSA
jgi:hypothetical protein